MIEVKLWRFSLPDTQEVLYLYSLTKDETVLRNAFLDQDGGDIDPHIYKNLYVKGKIERITSIDQVPTGKPDCPPYLSGGQRDWYPYCTDEMEYADFELTITDFFDPPERYR